MAASGKAAHTDFDDFVQRYHGALKQQTQGDSAALLGLWSRAGDVAFMSPMGGYQLGYEQVSGLLSAAAPTLGYEDWSAETLVKVVSGDIAHTAEIEHFTRRPDPARESSWPDEVVLRVTGVYRREDGEWRIILRHAQMYEELNFPPYTDRKSA
jgi:hypothetical protein